MKVDVFMPNLGFDTKSARLIEWLKRPGDAVTKGEPIAIIESDKANVELEAIASGVLVAQLAQAEQDVAIGAVIAQIGTPEDFAKEASSTPALRADPGPAAEDGDSHARVSPLAMRVALDLKVDIDHVTGSGVRGRVTREDVEAFHRSRSTENGTTPATVEGADQRGVKALPQVRRAARERGIDLQAVLKAGFNNIITMATLDSYAKSVSAQATPAAPIEAVPSIRDASSGTTMVPLSRARQVIGRRLSESMREAPHFYVTGEFDFEPAVARLDSMKTSARINDLLLYVATQTLLRVPALNRTWQDGTLYQHDSVHVALAVARDDGLITPVLHGAERFSLVGLAAEIRALIDRTRSNRLTSEDLTGGTFTVSNMGMVSQVDHFTAVINPPQVAILAIGALKQRPVAHNGGLFLRRTAHLTLSGDHRAVDGMDLARFMAVFQEELDRISA